MKVRDFAAELISEIADELGYLVFRYECSSASCGSIVFELEVSEEGKEEVTRKYKLLDYSGYEIALTNPANLDVQGPFLGRETIDLHRPESVQDLREWFEDSEKSFDSPLGAGMFNGYSSWSIPNGITTSPLGNTIQATGVNTIGTTTVTTTNVSQPLCVNGATATISPITIGTLTLTSDVATGWPTVMNSNIGQVFGSVNPSFGKLSFGGP